MKREKSGSPAGRGGFTLIELMIVVAIIGILAAIAIPKFAELIRKSTEGQVKGSMGAIRSALSIYYGDMEGLFPGDVYSLTISGKYMSSIPAVKIPNYHASTSIIRHNQSGATRTGFSGWPRRSAPACPPRRTTFIRKPS